MQDMSWDVSPLAAAIRLLLVSMFKLEDVAMGIWIADLKKNGLEVRYDQEEGVYNEGCKDGYVLDTEFFDLVFMVDIAIVVEDSMTWICGGCGGVDDSSSSSFEILIVGIEPLLLSGTKIHKFIL
ncbi:beta-1,3-galactosyltransferase GALT1 [Tanacetum coccineum]